MSTSPGNRRWGIIVLLIIDYFVMFVARSGMSMCGPALMQEYGWSAMQFGWVSTAFFIGYAVTMLPAGLLADRFGGGVVLVTGTLWWAVFTFLTPLGSTLGIMMLLRILVGIGQGLLVPANFSLAAKWVPKHEAGMATGLLQIGCPTGIAVAMVLAAWIVQRWDWQAVFYVVSVPGVLWCLLWWKLGSNRPQQDTFITQGERDYILAGQVSTEISPATQNEPLSKGDILATPSVWACALCYFCTNYLFFLFMTWLPTYFAMGRGIDLKQSAIFSMLPYLVAIFAYPLGGVVTDAACRRFGQNVGRKISPVLGLLLAGVFLILGTQANSLWSAATLISASNFFLCFTMAAHFSIPIIFSQKDTGMLVGLNGVFGTLAGILSPVLAGWVIDVSGGQYEYALYLGAGVAIVGAFFMLIARIRPIEKKSARVSAGGRKGFAG
ncbi:MULTISPECIES: MFS transporter [Citrobacter]|uniref:D-glucarate permease n=1 Tax=Citrobacter werkmanii TaxID=67827 RepID=A0A9N8GQR1_9ENTR|nr:MULTISPECIES: MFS transporter [Citrobacter]AYL65167.1 MFS transporter [Citrobacter werkmanii]MBJ8366930.1 MFS transporter [Citrobacter cronae]MBJ8395833.1 MFS transporter [Citrobacter cronae]MBJ8403139.1 MFS transporter [Citrobacter cronae]MBJ8408700.1 MFS transporter [Citrobacter cronae]